MTDAQSKDLKRRITAFVEHWVTLGGDRYEAPTDSDWNRYGLLEAHLLRFCTAFLENRPDTQWDWVEVEDAAERNRLWQQSWPSE